MKIEEFEELTSFMSNEFYKMTESYGVTKPSEHFTKFIENTLIKYSQLYDKPLYKVQKADVKLIYKRKMLENKIENAIFTMPHGWIWKFFHWELWKKVKERLSKEDKPKKELKVKKKKVETLYPEVVKQTTLPSLADDESLD